LPEPPTKKKIRNSNLTTINPLPEDLEKKLLERLEKDILEKNKLEKDLGNTLINVLKKNYAKSKDPDKDS
jgi:hypothetical protein